MENNLTIGNWIKVRNDDTHYQIKDIELSTGMVTLCNNKNENVYTSIRSIERKWTNEEVYGHEDERTIDNL